MSLITNAYNFGLFDSETEFKQMTDREVGLKAIELFDKYSTSIWGREYNSNYNHLVTYYDSLLGGQIAGLGLGIKLIDFDLGDLEDAMKIAAQNSQGLVPKDLNSLRNALQTKAMELVPYFELLESAQGVIRGAGDKLVQAADLGIQSIASINKYLPMILGVVGIIGVGYFLSQAKYFRKRK